MVTSPADLYGAALVGCCYRIGLEVKSNDNHSSRIHNVDIPGSTPIARQHRPFTSAVDDFRHSHFHWNTNDPRRGLKIRLRAKTEWEKQIQHDNDVAAREIREAAQQSGGRLPDRREAQAMARLCEIAERIAVNVRWYEEFGVQRRTQFRVMCTRDQPDCKAQLFVDGPEKALATGSGVDHFKAMQELEQEVVYRSNERRKTSGRR